MSHSLFFWFFRFIGAIGDAGCIGKRHAFDMREIGDRLRFCRQRLDRLFFHYGRFILNRLDGRNVISNLLSNVISSRSSLVRLCGSSREAVAKRRY